MPRHTFALRGDYVELHTLLKLLAIAPSGGAAKAMVAEGAVTVDGVPESRKARKLYAGSVVCVGDEEIAVVPGHDG